jgi:uncharacterized protein with GYD domain
LGEPTVGLSITQSKKEEDMPHYMYQASYSPEAIKTLVNNPQDRTGAAKAAIEANGGTMIGAWMAFGGDDLVVIADMPDDASMAGVALAVSAAGAIVGGKTTRLLDMPTAVEGMKKAKAVFDAYRPPS